MEQNLVDWPVRRYCFDGLPLFLGLIELDSRLEDRNKSDSDARSLELLLEELSDMILNAIEDQVRKYSISD